MLKFFFKMIYNALWHLVLPIWSGIHLGDFAKSKKEKKAFRERLALYPNRKRSQKPCLWFHGASLGEVISLLPLMEALKARFPQTQILSTGTIRGRVVADEKSQSQTFYLPLDISYVVRRALKRWKPDLVILFETEIWPNLFWECEKAQIPIVIISGRISPRSFPRYRSARLFFSRVLDHGQYWMQSNEDKERILQIGAPREQIKTLGDIKLDGLRTELSAKEIEFWAKILPKQNPIFVAGSTHPGEEALLLDIYNEVKKKSHVQMIIAPRHLHRLADIIALLEQRKMSYALRSSLPSSDRPDIILLDTYGELSQVYSLADWVFVGGTFVPVGGHNLMEPAALAKPVFFGPYTANCKKQAQLLIEKEAGSLVSSPDELTQKWLYFLEHPEESRAMGQRGQAVVLCNQGARMRYIQEIEKILGIIA